MAANIILPIILFRVGLSFLKAGKNKLVPELEKVLGTSFANEVNEHLGVEQTIQYVNKFIHKRKPNETGTQQQLITKERTIH